MLKEPPSTRFLSLQRVCTVHRGHTGYYVSTENFLTCLYTLNSKSTVETQHRVCPTESRWMCLRSLPFAMNTLSSVLHLCPLVSQPPLNATLFRLPMSPRACHANVLSRKEGLWLMMIFKKSVQTLCCREHRAVLGLNFHFFYTILWVMNPMVPFKKQQ